MRRTILNTLAISLPRICCGLALLCLCPQTVLAWGSVGHYQVGRLALDLADEKAATHLSELLDIDNAEAVSEACNWPDRVRETAEWEWSAPQHYVNIPRSVTTYDRERDCPSKLCVTEAVKKYANQLADLRVNRTKRWQAFAWLCHLVGDLHQPLHAGYKDDLGGNNYPIVYRDQAANLHQFWDRILISDRLGNEGEWENREPANHHYSADIAWNPLQVDEWTSESHMLVEQSAYPPDKQIQPEFADQSWLLIQQQWLKAGGRLALIINATLGQGELDLSRETRAKPTGLQ